MELDKENKFDFNIDCDVKVLFLFQLNQKIFVGLKRGFFSWLQELLAYQFSGKFVKTLILEKGWLLDLFH